MTLTAPSPTTSTGSGRAGLTAVTALTPMVWGTTYLVTTEMLPAGHPGFAAAIRAVPAGLIALAIARQLPRGVWWWRSLVIGTLNIGVFFPLLFVSAERLPGGVAATFGALQPLVVAGLAVVVLHQPLSAWRVGWGLAGFAGVSLVVLGPDAGLDRVGVAAGIAGAASMALGVTLAKRWGRPAGVSAIGFAGWQLTAAGVVLVPIGVIEGPPAKVDAAGVSGYLWLGIVGGLLAYALWFRGIGRLPVTSVAMLGLLSPIVAAALGAVVLGETFAPLQIAGFVLALVAILGSQLPEPLTTPNNHINNQGENTMKVLVIGGTGYIGSAVVRRLRSTGHEPVVLVRDSDPAPDSIPTRVGDLTDPDSLRAVVTRDIDAVVHAATPTGSWDADLAALAALTESLDGRALVYLSGVWVLGRATEPVDETAPTNPIEIVSGRPRLERHVLETTHARGIVVRPGIVHGFGGGIPGMMVEWARTAGTGRFVGDPTVRWSMVHVDDLADLIVLALDRAPTGTLLHGVAESGVAVKELAVAADVAAGGTGQAEAWDVRDAAAELSAPFAEALALHQEVTAGVARRLGWTPVHSDAVRTMRSARA